MSDPQEKYPEVQVRCGWSNGDDTDSGVDEVTGYLVAPGLAVADWSGMEHTPRHWAVVHLETEVIMHDADLCEACAYAAARVLAQVPGWDRSADVIKSDPDAFVAVEKAEAFGPCFVPDFVAEKVGIPMRVAYHVPGQPYVQPPGMPQGLGVIVPADVADEDLPELPPDFAQRLAEAKDRATRPWYEQE